MRWRMSMQQICADQGAPTYIHPDGKMFAFTAMNPEKKAYTEVSVNITTSTGATKVVDYRVLVINLLVDSGPSGTLGLERYINRELEEMLTPEELKRCDQLARDLLSQMGIHIGAVITVPDYKLVSQAV